MLLFSPCISGMMSGYSVMIIDTYKTLLEKLSRFLTEKNGKSSECSILAVPDNIRGLSKKTGEKCLYIRQRNIHLSEQRYFLYYNSYLIIKLHQDVF